MAKLLCFKELYTSPCWRPVIIQDAAIKRDSSLVTPSIYIQRLDNLAVPSGEGMNASEEGSIV